MKLVVQNENLITLKLETRPARKRTVRQHHCYPG
jgi:hypothetical protein